MIVRPAEPDSLFGGRLLLHQLPRGAYRTNIDAVLLAAFAAEARGPRATRTAFDLGAGVGAVGLCLLHLGGARRVVFVEVDACAAALLGRNLAANGLEACGELSLGDVEHIAERRPGDGQLVVCNPPFIEPGRGRPPADEGRARARSGSLATFVRAARRIGGRRARACFVYPARELSSLLTELARAGLEAKRMRTVHANARSPGRVVLVEAMAAKSGGLVVLPPLIEREEDGYSRELRALLDHPGRTASGSLVAPASAVSRGADRA